MKKLITICVVAIFVTPVTALANTTINFDDVTAPGLFMYTVALRDNYSSFGVHFLGPGTHDGGAILNQSGGFGVNAHSGTNFLAFNRNPAVQLSDGGKPTDPETITFDMLVSNVSIYAAYGSENTFTMNAYDAANSLVDTDTVTTQNWALLSVSWAAGIHDVILTVGASGYAFVYDDLTFSPISPIPAPGAIALGSIGVAFVGWLRRRRTL